MDDLSTRIGACNTIVRGPDGRLFGFNTDVSAIIGPLERRLSLKGARVLVLGAGGAARAAVFGLKEKGAEVHILNRTPESAKELATQAKAKVFKREQLTKTDFDVVLNATPAGMHGSKVDSLLEPDELRARLVFDMVYNPIETPLLRMAHEKGIAIIPGLEMFVHPGRAPIRNMDRQACAGGGHAPRRDSCAAAAARSADGHSQNRLSNRAEDTHFHSPHAEHDDRLHLPAPCGEGRSPCQIFARCPSFAPCCPYAAKLLPVLTGVAVGETALQQRPDLSALNRHFGEMQTESRGCGHAWRTRANRSSATSSGLKSAWTALPAA